MSACSLDLKFHPTINRSCPLGVLIDQRFALANASSRHTIGVDPLGRKLLHHDLSAPLTYAAEIHTPLLIQHSERDIRTTIGQAEALFTALRSLRRPVRLVRVPDETHELTRSGTPFRRAENLDVVLGWFRHYLVEGKRGLPPIPKIHGGR